MLLSSRFGVGGVLDNPHGFGRGAQGRGKPRPLLFADLLADLFVAHIASPMSHNGNCGSRMIHISRRYAKDQPEISHAFFGLFGQIFA
jgi:hypothetical protein